MRPRLCDPEGAGRPRRARPARAAVVHLDGAPGDGGAEVVDSTAVWWLARKRSGRRPRKLSPALLSFCRAGAKLGITLASSSVGLVTRLCCSSISAGWKIVADGSTIGHRKLDRTDGPVTARRLRLSIESALATPRIATVSLYRDG